MRCSISTCHQSLALGAQPRKELGRYDLKAFTAPTLCSKDPEANLTPRRGERKLTVHMSLETSLDFDEKLGQSLRFPVSHSSTLLAANAESVQVRTSQKTMNLARQKETKCGYAPLKKLLPVVSLCVLIRKHLWLHLAERSGQPYAPGLGQGQPAGLHVIALLDKLCLGPLQSG